MADLKISALPAASVALAGTEVLPIVQSSATKQVTVANLTAGRAVATGALTVTGDATLSTGNLVPSTAAKGINFTANTPAAGMTSQLLNWYEEGTWTPVLAADTTNATLSVAVARYTRIGNIVSLFARLACSAAPAGTTVRITGLPFTPKNTTNYFSTTSALLEYVTYTGQAVGFINPGTAIIYLGFQNTSTALSIFTGAAFANNATVTINISYQV